VCVRDLGKGLGVEGNCMTGLKDQNEFGALPPFSLPNSEYIYSVWLFQVHICTQHCTKPMRSPAFDGSCKKYEHQSHSTHLQCEHPAEKIHPGTNTYIFTNLAILNSVGLLCEKRCQQHASTSESTCSMICHDVTYQVHAVLKTNHTIRYTHLCSVRELSM
jgi:hypothetical protein